MRRLRTDSGAKSRSRVDRLDSHLALIVSGAIVAFAVYQVMALSNWNQETAQSIIQEQGTVQIVTGTLFELIQMATPVALLVAMTLPWSRSTFFDLNLSSSEAWMIAWTGLVIALVALPIWGLIAVGGMGLLIGASAIFFRRWERRHPQPDPTPEQMKAAEKRAEAHLRTLLPPMILGFAVLLLGNDPWLPRENLTFDGGRVEVGYVVNADSDEVVYLDAAHHQVHRVPSSTLASRGICEWRRSGRHFIDKSLAQIAFDDPAYPSCHRDDDSK